MNLRKRIRYKWLKLNVRIRKSFRSLDGKLTVENREITTYEEKAVRLWKILVKNEETQMSYNTFGVRQLEKDNVFIISQPSGNTDCLLTIMDISSETRSLYELHIPGKHAEALADFFDDEMEKRMKRAEKNKRKIIETDINNLLEKEELKFLEKKS